MNDLEKAVDNADHFIHQNDYEEGSSGESGGLNG